MLSNDATTQSTLATDDTTQDAPSTSKKKTYSTLEENIDTKVLDKMAWYPLKFLLQLAKTNKGHHGFLVQGITHGQTYMQEGYDWSYVKFEPDKIKADDA